MSATRHKQHIDTYTNQLKAFKDSTSEHLRDLTTKVQKYSQNNKNGLNFLRNFKILTAQKQRISAIFSKWKKNSVNRSKGKKMIKKLFLEKDKKRMFRGWNRLHGAYLLCRLKNFENKSIKALLRADDCQGKLLEVLPEVINLKKTKANNEDLVSLAGSVSRINYSSIFNDLSRMINEESLKLQKDLLDISQSCEQRLSNFQKCLEIFSNSLKSPDFLQDFNTFKSQLSSLNNMQVLLSEKVARIDFWNKKEENEFKLEVMTKQIKNLESRMMSISSSQDNIQDQAVFLKNILQAAGPGSKNSIRMNSTLGTRTGDSAVGTTPVHGDHELTVSGVYFKPNKRVASASPGKQKVLNVNRKYRIPTSFSSTLSITETPSLGFYRAG
jgi:hypothetical protein